MEDVKLDVRAALTDGPGTPPVPQPRAPLLVLARSWSPSAAERSRLEATLSADERARHARFRFERDRTTFLIARALLRHLLGAALARAPDTLSFAYDDYGKPTSTDPEAPYFNVAHCDGLVAVALSHDARIGVDVELTLPERAALEAARAHFAPCEIRTLDTAPAAQRHDVFFRLWTLKEAYVKARGQGLSIPLDSFMFALESSPPGFRCTGDDATTWRFHEGKVDDRWRWAVAHAVRGAAMDRLRVVA